MLVSGVNLILSLNSKGQVMSEVHRNIPCVKCGAPVALDKHKLGDLFDYGNIESECLGCGTVNQILLRHRVSPRKKEANTDEPE